MSLDNPASLTHTALADPVDEARRQIDICNACRYCEGYCSVFPAMTRNTDFGVADLTHLANLCHNCRGCYYACQYTEPHEFALNLPAALARVRTESWADHIGPRWLSRSFQTHGAAIAGLVVLALALMFAALGALRPEGGEGFYAHLAHNAMVAIFAPAFLAPLAIIALGLRSYWRATGGGDLRLSDLRAALRQAATMKNLDGGQGQGCNFEAGDRFSNRRRHAHQAVMWGFVMCFAATSVATLMHYGLNWPAPYPWWSPPKLLGVPGGVLMVVGAFSLIRLKLRADPELGDARVWGGEMGFVLLLGATALTGLALYAATGTGAVRPLLAVHLATVLALFLLMPWSKMVHGFFRLTALVAEAAMQRRRGV
jgi:citrate/tricarballylate utilization protein